MPNAACVCVHACVCEGGGLQSIASRSLVVLANSVHHSSTQELEHLCARVTSKNMNTPNLPLCMATALPQLLLSLPLLLLLLLTLLLLICTVEALRGHPGSYEHAPSSTPAVLAPGSWSCAY